MRTDARIRLAGRMDGTVDAMATRTPKCGLFLVMVLGVTLLTGCGALPGAAAGTQPGTKPPIPNLSLVPKKNPAPQAKPDAAAAADPLAFFKQDIESRKQACAGGGLSYNEEMGTCYSAVPLGAATDVQDGIKTYEPPPCGTPPPYSMDQSANWCRSGA